MPSSKVERRNRLVSGSGGLALVLLAGCSRYVVDTSLTEEGAGGAQSVGGAPNAGGAPSTAGAVGAVGGAGVEAPVGYKPPVFRFLSGPQQFSRPGWAPKDTQVRWALLREGGRALGVMEVAGDNAGLEVWFNALDATALWVKARVRSSGESQAELFLKDGEYDYADGGKVPVGSSWVDLSLDPSNQALWEQPTYNPSASKLLGLALGQNPVLHVDSVWFQPPAQEFSGKASLSSWSWQNGLAAVVADGEGGKELHVTGDGEGEHAFPRVLDLSDLLLAVTARAREPGATLELFARDDAGKSATAGTTLLSEGWQRLPFTFRAPEGTTPASYHPSAVQSIGLRVRGAVAVRSVDYEIAPDPPTEG
jgi:hypothetical protein